MAERGAKPNVPTVQRRALDAVRSLFTPLLPDDYLELINPLWSTRELRGRIERIEQEGQLQRAGKGGRIIAKLNGAMVQVLADPAVRARFAELGLDVASREQQTPEGLAAFQQDEIEKWWPIIMATNVKPECK